MKTILFSTDPKEIEKYGSEVIIAKDPIKTLRAMKQLENKEEYEVVGDEKYVEFAKQLGYNKPVVEKPKEHKEPDITEVIDRLSKSYKKQIKDLENKHFDELAKIKSNYDNKLSELEKEKVLIKKAIKQAINGTN